MHCFKVEHTMSSFVIPEFSRPRLCGSHFQKFVCRLHDEYFIQPFDKVCAEMLNVFPVNVAAGVARLPE